jgi:hypothetical protein
MWLLLVLGLFALVIMFINPLREFGFNDDWAYALVVRQLLQTGIYQPNQMIPALVLVHTYWGALLASIFGYSFASLHLSTVMLAVIGLVGFYYLAREHGVAGSDAFVLTVILMSSPLVLQYSVTFMTDIPYLTYLILSLLFYTRGLRLQNTGLMVLGGLCAACAIGARLFGVMLIPGIALVWLFGNEKRRMLPRVIAGLVPACVMLAVTIAYQTVSNGDSTAGTVSSDYQRVYLSMPGLVAGQIVWRIMIGLQYAAFFCSPILIPAFLEYRQRLVDLRKVSVTSPGGRSELFILLGLTLFILGASLLGSFVLNQPGVMPIIKWNFFGLSHLPTPVIVLITLGTMIGAFLIGRLLILRYLKLPGWRDLPDHERALDLTTGCILAVHLILFEIGDRYLLFLIPIVLIAAARGLADPLARWRSVTLAACAAVILISALWVRQTVSRAEAQWRAADALVVEGVPPEKIATMFEWNSYQGEFEKYMAEVRKSQGGWLSSTYMLEWLGQQRKKADYLVFPEPMPPDDPEYEVVQVIPYRDMLLREQYVYVSRRKPTP